MSEKTDGEPLEIEAGKHSLELAQQEEETLFASQPNTPQNVESVGPEELLALLMDAAREKALADVEAQRHGGRGPRTQTQKRPTRGGDSAIE